MKNVQSRNSTLISEMVILEPLKSKKDSCIIVLEPKLESLVSSSVLQSQSFAVNYIPFIDLHQIKCCPRFDGSS